MAKLFIVVSLVFSIVSAAKISSKIDLDSDEECGESSAINSDPVIIVIKNKPDTLEKTHEPRTSGWRAISGGNFNDRFPGNSMRRRKNHNPPSGESKVIKNIYIVVNGADVTASIPNSFDCKNNVCETTVTATNDDEDNEIGSVSVKVLTKPKDLEIQDVPVIDGIRASGYEHDRDSPGFDNNDGRFFPRRHFIDNNIARERVPRRKLPKPQSASFHPRNFGAREGSTVRNPWIPDKSFVDDKIEPPLSQTDHIVH